MKIMPILWAAAPIPLAAQEIEPPANFEKLAAKAGETVIVTLDGFTLRFARGPFRIETITVRSFEFPVKVGMMRPMWSRFARKSTGRRDRAWPASTPNAMV